MTYIRTSLVLPQIGLEEAYWVECRLMEAGDARAGRDGKKKRPAFAWIFPSMSIASQGPRSQERGCGGCSYRNWHWPQLNYNDDNDVFLLIALRSSSRTAS